MNFLSDNWEKILKDKEKIHLIELEVPVDLINPNTCHKFTITHKLFNSPNSFQATDYNTEKFFVKIFHCKSYEIVKKVYNRTEDLSTHFPTLIEPIKEFIEFLDNGDWGVALVSDWKEGVSLEELISISSEHLILSKELCISITLLLIKIYSICERSEINLRSIDPKYLFISKEKGSFQIISESEIFNLSVVSTSMYNLELELQEETEKELEAIWGTANCILYITSPGLVLTPEFVDNPFSIQYQVSDPALVFIFNELIEMYIGQITKIGISTMRILKAWEGMFTNDWDKVQTVTHNEAVVLESGIKLQIDSARNLSAIKLLELGLHHYNFISKYLFEKNILTEFIKEVIQIDFYAYNYLMVPLVAIMSYHSERKYFKILLSKLGAYHLFMDSSIVELSLFHILKLAKNHIQDNTLTALEILMEKDIHKIALANCKTEIVALEFLESTAHLFGSKSFDIIISYGENMNYNDANTLHHIMEIPCHFKMEKMDKILNYLITIYRKMKNFNVEQIKDVLKSSIFILGDILYMPEALETALIQKNCLCTCSDFFLIKLGHQRLLKRCETCYLTVCMVCANEFHSDHTTDFLLYQNTFNKCQESREMELPPPIQVELILPEYQNRLEFVLDNETRAESYLNIFSSSDTEKITLLEPLEKKVARSIFYYEVKILKAGMYEKIWIGACGFEYLSLTGVVKKDGVKTIQAPRAGSFDTIGFGVFPDGMGFITYNGFAVHPYFEIGEVQEFLPLVKMFGKGCQVQVDVRSWVFMGYPKLPGTGTVSNNKLEAIFGILNNEIKKLKKKNKDFNTMDINDKYLDLLKTLQLEEKANEFQKKETWSDLFRAERKEEMIFNGVNALIFCKRMGFSGKSGEVIKKKISDLGGKAWVYPEKNMESITHVIAPEGIYEEILKKAVDLDSVVVVSPEWAYKSLTLKEKLEEEKFIVEPVNTLKRERQYSTSNEDFSESSSESSQTKKKNEKINPLNFSSSIIKTSNLNSHLTDELEKIYAYNRALGDYGRKIAYGNAIRSLKMLPFKVENIQQVKNIRGIGEKILLKIQEILATGSTKKGQSFENNPKTVALKQIQSVHGIGPYKARILYNKGVSSLEGLWKYCLDNPEEFSSIEKASIYLQEDFQEKVPRKEISLLGEIIYQQLLMVEPKAKLEICGSYRRGRDWCGDIDIVIGTSRKNSLMKEFVPLLQSIDLVTHVFTKSGHTFMGVVKIPGRPHRRIDIVFCDLERMAFSVLYFTGSTNYNRMIREEANSRGWHLSNSGLYDIKTGVSLIDEPETEDDIIRFLGLPVLTLVERDI